jgi:hypothetical protein
VLLGRTYDWPGDFTTPTKDRVGAGPKERVASSVNLLDGPRREAAAESVV